MRIKEVVLKDFMKWRKTWRVDGFGHGVCKLVEHNEFGKSTILEALKAVLQYRHRSSKAQLDFRPVGDKVSPEVSILFEIDGQDVKIWKKFGGSTTGKALLEVGGRRFEDDAAEDELEKILGLKSAARGAGQSGVWGALWLDQTQSVLPPSLDDAARSTIHGAIVNQVGHVTGGDRGVKILEKLRREVGESRGERGPKGKLKVLMDEVRETTARLDEAREASRLVRDDVVRLEQVAAELRNSDEQNAVNQIKKDLAEQEANLERMRGLAGQNERLKRELAEAQSEHENASRNVARHEELKERIEIASRRVDSARSEYEDAKIELNTIVGEEAGISARLDDANAALTAAAAGLATAEKTLSMVVIRADIDASLLSLDQARTIGGQISDCIGYLESNRITMDALAELEALERKSVLAKASLEGGSSRISLVVSQSGVILRNGEVIDGDHDFPVIDPVDFSGQGFRMIVSPPAGSEREKIRQRYMEAEARLLAAMEKVGVSTMAEASGLAQKREREAGKLEVLRERMKLVAPGNAEIGIGPGIEGLEIYIRARQQRLDEIAAELGIGRASEIELASLEKATGVRMRAYEDHESARAARDRIQLEETSLRARKSGAENRLARAGDIVAESEATLEKEVTSLSGLLDGKTAEMLLHDRETARTKCEDLVKRLEVLGEPDLAGAEGNIGRLRRALEEDEAVRRRLMDERIALEASLGARRGFGEQESEIEARLSEMISRLARMEEDLAVAEMLLNALQAAEADAKERYVGPVKTRVLSALRVLVPDVEIGMDENMRIESIRRAGLEESIDILSTGMREQLAVLVRLAFAEMLIDNGLPAMLILDDALVYSDDTRLEGMFSILDDAAKRMQIVVLTCHGMAWRRLPGHQLKVVSVP